MINSIDSLWKLSAKEVLSLLEKKDVSPSEVLDSSINRIHHVNPHINAVVTLCDKRARKHIKDNCSFKNTILKKMPVLIKDMTEVQGVKTTYGSMLYKNYVPDKSDLLVSNIEQNGGVILGKTNTPEFAAGSNTYNDVFGVTKNPWNLKLSAGGSSGGSGAALASGMSWFSSGSDLGGSLRNPASWNGVVGLRPTPGLIAHGPSKMPFNSLSLNGPMARNIDDLSIFLDSMVSYNLSDPLSIKGIKKQNYSRAIETPINTSYKVGITDSFGIFPCCNEIQNMIRDTSKLINLLGHNIENTFPSMDESEEAFHIFRAFIFYYTYGYLLDHHKNVKKDIIWNIEKGKSLNIADFVRAENIRTRLYENISQFFKDFDFLICPSSSVVPFSFETNWVKKINNKEFDNYVSWLMICGCLSLINCPSVALPTSIAKNGAPIGVQIIAPPYEEAKLLNFAKSIENEINISKIIPIDPRNI